MEVTNKRWYRWHPFHQKSLHRKESVSGWKNVAFHRCIFCDVWEFYAFNDPCFALYQKQGMAEYTERTTFPSSFFSCFISWWKLMWVCEGDCFCHVWRKGEFTYIVWDSFIAGQETNKCLGVSVLLERDKGTKKKKHFNKPSSAGSGGGGCAHWITTLLLLHSIKSDSSLERGSWFDKFLLKQIRSKWDCGWAGVLVQSHLFIRITWTQTCPDDVMALCIINIERSFPLLGSHVHHMLGSLSNFPQDCLGHSYYLSGKDYLTVLKKKPFWN